MAAATTEIYTLSLHDALPISWLRKRKPVNTEDLVYQMRGFAAVDDGAGLAEATQALRAQQRSDGGWAQLTSLKRDRKSTRLNSSHTVISYAVFCLKKKKKKKA